MCKFFSFVVRKSSDQSPVEYLWRRWTDSHAEILWACGVSDSTHADRLAKYEFTPPDDGNWKDIKKWTLKLDDPTRPDWLTEKIETDALRWVETIIKARMLLEGVHRGLMDDFWLVGGTAVVYRVGGGARVIALSDNAEVSGVGGNAQVSVVGGIAQVSVVGGDARVSVVGDNARVSCVGGNAKVTVVGGDAQVFDVRGNAQVSDVGGEAKVSYVLGNAEVSNVSDKAQVSDVGDNARLDKSAKDRLE